MRRLSPESRTGLGVAAAVIIVWVPYILWGL
jgi:hypothetical protein